MIVTEPQPARMDGEDNGDDLGPWQSCGLCGCAVLFAVVFWAAVIALIVLIVKMLKSLPL